MNYLYSTISAKKFRDRQPKLKSESENQNDDDDHDDDHEAVPITEGRLTQKNKIRSCCSRMTASPLQDKHQGRVTITVATVTSFLSIGQTLLRTGVLKTFYEDDQSIFHPRFLNILCV